MQQYTIGQTAKLAGLTTKTIRFYEDEGVIEKPLRSENGYRVYDEKTVEELKLLKYAREMGLPLTEIKKLMKGCEGGHCEHSKDYIDKNIGEYLQILTEKIDQLSLLKTRLRELKKKLETEGEQCSKGIYCCDLFHQLVNFKNSKEVKENDEKTMLRR